MKKELKPCPFCGSDKLKYYSGWGKDQDRKTGGRNPTICCPGCDIGFTTGYYGFGIADDDVENEIIERWNREPEDYPEEYETKLN